MFFRKSKFNTMDMADAIAEMKYDPSIHLIDVRTPEEYVQKHIPKSVNIPLNQAQTIIDHIPDQAAKLFVYCQSGMRSRSACTMFAKLGYTNVTNIGGIYSWNG